MSDDRSQSGGIARLLPTTRLEAFSDGVFAIAITLLVLELHVPTDPQELLRELGAEWPSYLGYFVSFAFIGGVWMAHSNLTRFTKAADQVMMGLNLVLLLFVSFLPFTTSLLANHLDDSAAHIAVVIFGVNLTLASLMVNVMFGYASRTPASPPTTRPTPSSRPLTGSAASPWSSRPWRRCSGSSCRSSPSSCTS